MDAEQGPILVSGLGRSGTTWMQWYLSKHPRIQIHGQSPNIDWDELWQWAQRLSEQGRWAQSANRQVGYETAYYAGSPPERARQVFREMFCADMTGFGPPADRWGLKWIGLCASAEAVRQWETLWPRTRWIVCLRDPFRTINSLKNTFQPDLDPAEYAHRWVAVCRFLKTHDPARMAAVHMDRLQEAIPEVRQETLRAIWPCLHETPTAETDAFVQEWPVVHKQTPDHARRFALTLDDKRQLLDEVPGLTKAIEEQGYPLPE